MFDMIARRMPEPPTEEARAILLAVGGLIQREVAIDELLQRMVDLIAEKMNADRGTIYVVDRGKREVFSKAAHLPEIEEIRLQLGQGVAGFVAESGQVVNVPTTTTDARFFAGIDQRTGYRTSSILAVPMRDREGQIIGVVQLLNKKSGSFPLEDEGLLVALAEQAALAIESTTLYRDLAREPEEDQRPLPLAGRFNLIVGESELLQRACRLTRKAAATEATILIRGESGTGKELFARAIHVNSARAEGPFVKVDCAALPETLIENELFGHERGAFTGADQRSIGKFDAAEGGTIFLDEIGELPLAVQGKLLRVLQDREYDRVGGTETVSADVRVVAATNRDLERMVAEGRFRSDLYYRIKVVQLELPPLRERGRADIRRLAQHFAVAAARRHGRPIPAISEAAFDRLGRYGWPGNVRELENCLESAVVIMEGDRIRADDLPLPDRVETATSGPPDERIRTLEEVEREHILRVLERCDGNRSEAAHRLGIGRNTLTRKLKGYE